MRDTKTEFKFFTIPEWKKEEKYLREQHKKWLGIYKSGFYWFVSF